MNKRNMTMEDGTSASASNKRQLSEDTPDGVSHCGSGSRKKSHIEDAVRAVSNEASDSPFCSASDTNGISSALGLLREANTKQSKDATKLTTLAVTEEFGVTFPERLMELLMNETDKDALWWLPDGMTFAIHSKAFTKTILAKNFQGSKFESFTRKLARWGFKRLSGPDIPPHTFFFQHPHFQKEKPELAKDISGNKKKLAPMTLARQASPQSADPSSCSVTEAALKATPSPAPWPTFADQYDQRLHRSGLDPSNTNTTNTTNTTTLYEAINNCQLQPQAHKAATSSDAQTGFSSSTHLLQPDLDMHRLLRSAVSSFGERPGVTHRHQEDLRETAAYLAKHIEDRTRRVLPSKPFGVTSTNPSRSLAELSPSLPSTSIGMLPLTGRVSSELTSASATSPNLFSASRNSMPSNNATSRALAAAAGWMGPSGFLAPSSNRASSAIPPTLPTEVASAVGHTSPVSNTSLDLVRRLYLQQQETSRQHALLLHRNDVLMTELLRREQKHRQHRNPRDP